ncbi:hypothetical protein Goshw_012052, partial [Gossypium schwendimanii]|nr:hypothetical protein [Gossypium schwendimanii]
MSIYNLVQVLLTGGHCLIWFWTFNKGIVPGVSMFGFSLGLSLDSTERPKGFTEFGKKLSVESRDKNPKLKIEHKHLENNVKSSRLVRRAKVAYEVSVNTRNQTIVRQDCHAQ